MNTHGKSAAKTASNSNKDRRLSHAELLTQKGIKAQICIIAHLESYLRKIGSQFSGESTTIGGDEDRLGIDWWLVNEPEGWKIPVDFSFSYKDGASVQLQHEWFVEQADGTLRFLDNNAQALFRAFMVVVSNPALRVHTSRN